MNFTLTGISRTSSYSSCYGQMILSAVYVLSPVDIIPEGILLFVLSICWILMDMFWSLKVISCNAGILGIVGLLDDLLIVLICFLHVAAIYRSVLYLRHGGSWAVLWTWHIQNWRGKQQWRKGKFIQSVQKARYVFVFWFPTWWHSPSLNRISFLDAHDFKPKPFSFVPFTYHSVCGCKAMHGCFRPSFIKHGCFFCVWATSHSFIWAYK